MQMLSNLPLISFYSSKDQTDETQVRNYGIYLSFNLHCNPSIKLVALPKNKEIATGTYKYSLATNSISELFQV